MKRGKMKQRYVGSGCGSVGRAVASDSEVHGSNGVIGNIYIEIYCQLHSKRRKLKKKEAGNGPFLKILDREQLFGLVQN